MRTGLERAAAAAHVPARPLRRAGSRLEASGLGLEAITSLERIVASGASLEMKDQDGQQGLLVAIEGAIDRAMLKKSMPPGTAVERFRGAELFVPPGAKPGEPLVALLGSRWMLIGDRSSLAVILNGRGGPADVQLHGRAARLALDGEMWRTVSHAALCQGGAPAAGPLGALRELDLLISLQRGLRLQASLAGESPELARSLAAMLQHASAASDEAASAWSRHLQVATKGTHVFVTLDLPAAGLESVIGEAKASMLALGRLGLEQALSGGGTPAPAGPRTAASADSAPRPEIPAAGKVQAIRIVGLDDGPREIPYPAPAPPGSGP